MQYWVNDEGQMLTVVDITKIVGSESYGKRVKHDRYVVSYGLSSYRLRMTLTFDYMSGVRFWMSRFGYKLVKKE